MIGAARTPLDIVACVDDFGLNDGVNRAVLALAARGLVSATSCMVNMPEFSPAAVRAAIAAGIDVGLHLNLTEGIPVSVRLRAVWPRFPSLGALLVRSHAGMLPRAAIAEECCAQIDRFIELAGRPPDFLDGHQHVHHLPVIRAAWLGAVQARGLQLYVRDAGSLRGPGFAVKRAIIRWTGGRQLSHLLVDHGLPRGSPLFGSYDFGAGSYRGLMRGWLGGLAADGELRGLLFCHPSHGDSAVDHGDSIGAARQREWEYLDSPAWCEDLAAVGARLVRGADAFT